MTDLAVTLQISRALSKVCSSGRRMLDSLETRKKQKNIVTCSSSYSIQSVLTYDSYAFLRQGMRRWYAQLHEINRTLITQHQIRCTTNENMMESIKTVNQIVQRAARLRGKLSASTSLLVQGKTHHISFHELVCCLCLVGRPKANVITACREAIRMKKIDALNRIIKHGA